MKVFKFATGFAIGYVLGSRAGRDRYDQIVTTARKAQNHPAVTQVQHKAKGLLGAPDAATEPARDKTSSREGSATPKLPRRQTRKPVKTASAPPDPLV